MEIKNSKEQSTKEIALPKKFYLKFGGSYITHSLNTTVAGRPVFKNKHFTTDSLIAAMIEKGVLEVVPVEPETKWRLYIKTEKNEIRYLISYEGGTYWGCKGYYTVIWDKFEDIPSAFGARKNPSERAFTWYTIYAEEFEVEEGA